MIKGNTKIKDEQTVKLSISLSQFCYETLSLATCNNRSRYIERLLLMGLDSEIASDKTLKSRLADSLRENRNLKDTVNNLKSQIEKNKMDKKENIEWL